MLTVLTLGDKMVMKMVVVVVVVMEAVEVLVVLVVVKRLSCNHIFC